MATVKSFVTKNSERNNTKLTLVYRVYPNTNNPFVLFASQQLANTETIKKMKNISNAVVNSKQT